MKKYIKADGIKTDIFKKAAKQAAINDIYRHLSGLIVSINRLEDRVEDSGEDLSDAGFAELEDVQRVAIDALNDVRPYYKG